ncbi:hypothetical protein ACFS6H_00580 [Terrimonas rubra]|uniref:Cytochrome B n=1 Tax=Terrimonas rubra TaxID=1035890 RepID=A0ABW5ZYT0_9BACT
MYPHLLATHNVVRWLVLIFLVIAILLAWRGWLGNKKFGAVDNRFRVFTVIFTHIQFILGIVLYFVSPRVTAFLDNVGAGMKDKDLRFVGMEHALLMLISVVLITIGSSKTKRQATDKAKFKTMAIWFTIALLLILFAIPWSMPHFRPF